MSFSSTGRTLRRKVKSKEEGLPSLADVEQKTTGRSTKQSVMRRSNWIIRIGLILIFAIINALFLIPDNPSETLQRKFTSFLVSQANTVEGALWRGTVREEDYSSGQIFSDRALKIDLVVSHCDRPIDWIFEWAEPITFQSVQIFSKCGKPVFGAPATANITRLENVGRCDHTYAHYIAANYNQQQQNNVDNDKFTLFLKDSDNLDRDILLGSRHRSLAEMIAVSKQFGFACQEEQVWDWKHKNDIERHSGICRFSAYSNWKVLQKYSIGGYNRLARDENSRFKSNYGNSLGAYAKRMGITVSSKIIPTCYGGNFMAQSQQLTSRSLQTWKKLEFSLSRANNIAEGHFVERLWAVLLSRELPEELQDQILKQKSKCEPPGHFFGLLAK